MGKKMLAALLAAVLLICSSGVAEIIEIQGTIAVQNIEVTPAPTDAPIVDVPLGAIEIVDPQATAQPVAPAASANSATVPADSAAATAEPSADTSASPVATEEPTPSPTAVPRLHGLIIGIDPGHQGKANSDKEPVAPDSKEMKAKVSSGTSGASTGIAEYITVLEISLKLRDALEAMGATVYMTRDTHDIDISNKERAEMMNELGADLVLRLHCDGAEDRSANGIGLFVRKTGEKQEESQAAAEVLLDAMVETTGAKRRDVYLRDTYTMNNWSIVPCILVEMGFMSNPEEDEKLNTPEYQDLLVEGMVAGICTYFER